jgi:FkbM family methyltransferase
MSNQNDLEKSQAERELDELLAERPDDAAQRAASQTPIGSGDRLVLYGAGTLGRTVLAKLRRVGLEPAAFADDTPEKQGQRVDGVEILTPREAVARFGEGVLFVVTIMNQRLRYVEARRRLQSLGGEASRVVSFMNLAWKYPEEFLPYYLFELPQVLLAKAEDIRRAFHAFEDEESRRQFVAHLRLRLHLDYDALPQASRDDYFPPALVPALPDDGVFVDCGAYDGDTLRRFLERQRGRFGRIYAFEPDALNCERLRAYVSTLDAEAARRIHVYHAGVGDRRTKIKFNATGDMSASFGGADGIDVDVLPLQEVVESNGGAIVYLKYDVEGAEWEALRGAQSLIERARPILAISVYHRPDDLWQLPLYVRTLDPTYRLFLRTQGEDGTDVICYAIPPHYTPPAVGMN